MRLAQPMSRMCPRRHTPQLLPLPPRGLRPPRPLLMRQRDLPLPGRLLRTPVVLLLLLGLQTPWPRFLWSAAAAGCEGTSGAVKEISVRDTGDATALADTVICTGGSFRVRWIGTVVVEKTIEIGDNTSVIIIGERDLGGRGLPVMDGEMKARLLLMKGPSSYLRVQGVELTRGNHLGGENEGGAIALVGASAVFENCTFSSNMASSGGAIYNLGSLELDASVFVNNGGLEVQNGGAVCQGADGNFVAIRRCRFSNNTAQSGGAVALFGKDGATGGDIVSSVFESNTATMSGGAISIQDFKMGDIWNCSFFRNAALSGTTAGMGGGAIGMRAAMAENVRKTAVGAISMCTFEQNRAQRGGAVFALDFTVTRGVEDSHFLNNSARGRGGAIYSTLSLVTTASSTGLVSVKRSSFILNSAVTGGGAVEALIGIDVQDCCFERNAVTDGSGGGFNAELSTNGFSVLNNSRFFSNSATVGGGGVMGPSRRVADISSSDSTGSGQELVDVLRAHLVTVKNSFFEKNEAVQFGGGLAAYHAEVTGTDFLENVAAEGGGVRVLDQLALSGGRFVSNRATNGGGLWASKLSTDGDSSVFHINVASLAGGGVFLKAAEMFLWPAGITFNGSEATCCYHPSLPGLPCSDADGQAGAVDACCGSGTWVDGAGCTPCPGGFDCGALGLVSDTAPLEPGFWRATLTTSLAEECFRGAACKGGLPGESRNEYCSSGYTGPYCAVCEKGYAMGLGYKCRKCSLLSVVLGMFVLIFLALILLASTWYVAAKLLENTNAANVLTVTQQAPTWAGARTLLAMFRAAPLGALRTPVVVLQILAQFASVTNVKFPPVYQNFLAAISGFSLDLGWLMTWGCLVDINFYDRLLVATLAPLAVVGLVAMSLVLTARDIRERYPEGDLPMAVVRTYSMLVRRLSSHDFGDKKRNVGNGDDSASGSSRFLTAADSECDEDRDEESEVGVETETERRAAAPSSAVAAAAVETKEETMRVPAVSPEKVAALPSSAHTDSRSTEASFSSASMLSVAAPAAAAAAHAMKDTEEAAEAAAETEEEAAAAAAQAKIDDEAEEMWDRALGRHGLVLMAFTFLIYSTVSMLIFQTFSCDRLEGVDESYLRADYSVSCESSVTRTAYVAYAAVMMVVYPIGIPAVYGYLLWRQRHRIADEQVPGQERLEDPNIQSTRFLWRPYTCCCYWWELAECVRRLSLTGLLVFILPGTTGQVAIACVFSVVSLLAVASFQPHNDPVDAAIYRLGCIIIFLSTFLAVTIAAEVSDEDAQSQEIVSILLILMNVGMVLAAFVQCAVIVRRLRQSIIGLPPQASSSAAAAAAAGGAAAPSVPPPAA